VAPSGSLDHRVQDSAKHGSAAVQLSLIELEEHLLSFSLLLADKRDLAAQNRTRVLTNDERHGDNGCGNAAVQGM
jgi:hypothetical protein